MRPRAAPAGWAFTSLRALARRSSPRAIRGSVPGGGIDEVGETSARPGGNGKARRRRLPRAGRRETRRPRRRRPDPGSPRERAGARRDPSRSGAPCFPKRPRECRAPRRRARRASRWSRVRVRTRKSPNRAARIGPVAGDRPAASRRPIGRSSRRRSGLSLRRRRGDGTLRTRGRDRGGPVRAGRRRPAARRPRAGRAFRKTSLAAPVSAGTARKFDVERDDAPARGDERAAKAHVGRDVGAAEPVDGLLRVAHDEERSALGFEARHVLLVEVVARQVQEDLGLQRVGVLELVHEKVREARREGPPNGGKVAQEIARREEQVRVRERPAAGAPRGEVRQRGTQDGVDPLVQRELPLGERGLDDVLAKIFEFLAEPLATRLVGHLDWVAPPRGRRRVLRRRANPAGVSYSGSCEQIARLEERRLQVVAIRRARFAGRAELLFLRKSSISRSYSREVRQRERVRDDGDDVGVFGVELEAVLELFHRDAEREEGGDGACARPRACRRTRGTSGRERAPPPAARPEGPRGRFPPRAAAPRAGGRRRSRSSRE